MHISVTKPYKSLQPFSSEELTPLTIITGLNGSGKTQLIELFKELTEHNAQKPSPSLVLTPSFLRLHVGDLITGVIGIGSPDTYKNQISSIHGQYQNERLHPQRIIFWKAVHEKKLTYEDLMLIADGNENYALKFKTLLTTSNSEITDTLIDDAAMVINNYKQSVDDGSRMLARHVANSFPVYGQSLHISSYQNKDLFKLSQSDFLQSVVPDSFIDNKDLLYSRVENIFYNYLKKRSINAYQYYRKTQFDESNNSISEKEFDVKYPSPWGIINNFLSSNKLGYYFKEISNKDFSNEANVMFEFIKRSTEQVIPFENLSSGEKVILGLLLKLFTTTYYDKQLTFPDLIILDEPDAHLHPQMSKILIDVLSDTFVKDLGIQVIITTHSPSTVALAPEETIYELRNTPLTSLKNVNKDHALKLLTSGLPNLSIDYKNHRQIFVESPTDTYYYQVLFDKLQAKTPLIHQLYFISTGYGKGNCDQVISLVNSLRLSGNTTSFGIVDWDNKNKNEDFIKVHGESTRYSVENFIFDPVYLSILLIELRYGHLRDEIGYADSDDPYDIEQLQLQKSIDFIMTALKPKLSPGSENGDLIKCNYGGGYSFQIPRWYLMANGHKLKERLIAVFTPLGDLRNNFEIETRLINIIGRVFPAIPEETEKLLRSLGSLVGTDVPK
jgi:predicted ATPase